MTVLLNLIVATAIEELEHAGNICDEASGTSLVEQSSTRRVHQTRTPRHARTRGNQPQSHNRPTVRHPAYVRERHERKEV